MSLHSCAVCGRDIYRGFVAGEMFWTHATPSLDGHQAKPATPTTAQQRGEPPFLRSAARLPASRARADAG